ncbi:hypothetical protein BH23BAC2_BH23BAC2_07450 [soil metagenome]
MVKALYLKVKTKILFGILFCLTANSLMAQETENVVLKTPNPFWQHVRFGGSIGLGFGNGSFNGIIAPSAIYDFNSKVSAGVSLSGAYAKYNNSKASSFGGSVIGMFRPIRELQLSAEYEQLNITRRFDTSSGNLRENYWVPALFLGIGYNTGPVVTGVRYNVLHDSGKSFYSSAFMPFVSIYF